jgi:glycosyltransferase involved in cell wall biosynthesis
MRVMHYSGARVLGGLLRHVEILVRGQRQAGHDVDLILSPATAVDPVAAAGEADGARVTRLGVRGKGDLPGLLRLRQQVAADRPDVFHLHLSSPIEGVPVLLAARQGGATTLVTTEHAPTWYPLERPWSRRVKRAAGRLLDACIAVSASDARFLETEFGVSPSHLRVVPNGVPPPNNLPGPKEARAHLGLSGGGPVVGHLGALEAKKGVFDLLRAAGQCNLEELTLLLGGAGSAEEELREESSRLPCTTVLAGQVRDTATFLAALDIFVLASHQEAMPLALLEAMATGRAIVATRVGGIPEAIEEGVSGLLVPPRSPQELARALERLGRDADLRRQFGERARQVAGERFSASGMVRRVNAVYREVLGQRPGRARK